MRVHARLCTRDLESLLGTLFDSTRVSFILQYIGTMDIKSKLTFVPLGHPISLDNMYDFFSLFFPLWASFVLCYLFYLSASFVLFIVACTCLK